VIIGFCLCSCPDIFHSVVCGPVGWCSDPRQFHSLPHSPEPRIRLRRRRRLMIVSSERSERAAGRNIHLAADCLQRCEVRGENCDMFLYFCAYFFIVSKSRVAICFCTSCHVLTVCHAYFSGFFCWSCFPEVLNCDLE